ncbi:unknown [Prevotella sp. CAG:487]|nr:unknown [Prevotella sp. CAG:487]
MTVCGKEETCVGTCLNPYTVSVLQNKNVKIFYCPSFMNK